MPKQYRDLTVGELIDMGMRVKIVNHHCPSKKEAIQFLAEFDGIKVRESAFTVDGEKVEVVEGKNEDYTFKFNNYIRTKK